MMTNDEATIMTIASTTGKSLRRTDSTNVDPIPGIRKTVSETIDPLINAPVLSPTTVIKEKSDGRNAWTKRMRHFDPENYREEQSIF